MDGYMVKEENNGITTAAGPAALVSAVAFLPGTRDVSLRILVKRDLSKELSSFTVSYSLARKGNGGKNAESRFFTLTYDREGLNTQEELSLRIKIPADYKAVACTAFVSEIVYKDSETETIEFGSPEAVVVREELSSPVAPKGPKKKKKIARKTKIIIIAASLICAAALTVAGGFWFNRYNGIKNIVNGLIDEKRYAEAYRIAEECSSASLVKTACGNIISSCLADRDYKTAYAYSEVSGKQKSVFRRVEYEMEMSGPETLEGDAFAVLRKLDNDGEFDSTLKKYIDKMCASGEYPSAMTAVMYIRNDVERKLLQRNVLVEGACYYARDGRFTGMERYDRALDFFHYYETGNRDTDLSVASEIVNRAVYSGDSAGAIVLSSYFRNVYPEFETDPATVTVVPGSPSIAHSLDYVYPLLSPAQKRTYHAETLALSEELFVIRDGNLNGGSKKRKVSVASYENRTAYINEDGTVEHIQNGGHNTVSTVPTGGNAVQVAVGLGHTVVLNADGTVTAVGDNSRGQCNVSDWSGIVEIAAGRFFTVGLRSDGTLVACGSNKCGQCHVSDLNNVISVKACDQTTVVLFADGTVKLRGYSSMGLDNANRFTGVTEIKAGGCTVIAKREDGTFVMADGSLSGPSGDVSGWREDNVSAYAVGSQCIAYQNASGKVQVTGVGA